MKKPDAITITLLLAALWLAFGGMSWQGCTLPVVQKVTAATYTYDDKRTSASPAVQAAMAMLNQDEIKADFDEVDTSDGEGDVPEQFKVSRPAAQKAGLPALVVLAGDKVLRVVKDPKTEDDVLKAVK